MRKFHFFKHQLLIKKVNAYLGDWMSSKILKFPEVFEYYSSSVCFFLKGNIDYK